VIVIAGTPQEAVRAGGDDRQPPLLGFFPVSLLLLNLKSLRFFQAVITSNLIPIHLAS